ncbi:MAG: hypothetical protein COA79_18170 [Planctomycetota bacterium]|nr:MAG: hypothetical protein COA79_18170 [Planctomycetota bacterium]
MIGRIMIIKEILNNFSDEEMLYFIKTIDVKSRAMTYLLITSTKAEYFLNLLSDEEKTDVIKILPIVKEEEDLLNILEKEIERVISYKNIELIITRRMVEMKTDEAKRYLELIAKYNPLLGEHIELEYDRYNKLMGIFPFEDILLIDDKSLQDVIREVEWDDLSLALKFAGDDIKIKIFKNVSARKKNSIIETMEFMGPVKVADVKHAQNHIMKVVNRRLKDGSALKIPNE